MATANIADFLDNDGNINMAELRRRGFLVKKTKRRRNTFRSRNGDESTTEDSELELYDAQSALINIGKHLGVFNDIQNNVAPSGPIFIQVNVDADKIAGVAEPPTPKANGS
jgi:hypothetical protein